MWNDRSRITTGPFGHPLEHNAPTVGVVHIAGPQCAAVAGASDLRIIGRIQPLAAFTSAPLKPALTRAY